MNALSLRLAATAEITLLKPDGSALADTDVTLRGGVYRDDVFAEYRDDAYCESARFARAAGETANLDGRQDMVFSTDKNGVLRIHMDLEQFTSRNDPDPVGVGDTLKFIFEVRFADGTLSRACHRERKPFCPRHDALRREYHHSCGGGWGEAVHRLRHGGLLHRAAR